MKVKYTSRCGRFVTEFEGDQKSIFEQIANFQEVFEDTVCSTKDGSVTSDNVRFVVRENDGNKFYELRCMDTDKKLRNARKAFGSHKTGGTLFPKGTWVKWDGAQEVEI